MSQWVEELSKGDYIANLLSRVGGRGREKGLHTTIKWNSPIHQQISVGAYGVILTHPPTHPPNPPHEHTHTQCLITGALVYTQQLAMLILCAQTGHLFAQQLARQNSKGYQQMQQMQAAKLSCSSTVLVYVVSCDASCSAAIAYNSTTATQ